MSCHLLLCVDGLLHWLIGSAIFTLAILGPYVAYAIPIGSRLIWSHRFRKGPWHLGRWSRIIAGIAIVWMTFACVIFCL